MPLVPRSRAQGAAARLASLAGALLVLGLLAGPVWATSGPTKLTDPTVNPTTALMGQAITFEVGYRNREGSDPDYVRVVIDGAARAMTATSADTNWKKGVRFRYVASLPLGAHAVTFIAQDREKFTDTISGGTVTVVAPEPTPTPKPSPTPTPKPSPSPSPTPKPSPTATPTPPPTPTNPNPSPNPQPGSTNAPPGDPATSTPPIAGAPGGDPRPLGPGGPGGGGSNGSGGSGGSGAGSPPGQPLGERRGGPGPHGIEATTIEPGEAVDGVAWLDSSDAAGSNGDPGSTGNAAGNGAGGPGSPATDLPPSSWARTTNPLDVLGLGPGPFGRLPALPVLITTTTAIGMGLAFLGIGKRRRDQEPTAPDEALSAAAARGMRLAGNAALVPELAVPQGHAIQAAPDAHIPRWRRPSLMEARKVDPTRTPMADPPKLSFAHGLVAPVDGGERRLIRYTIVQLLAEPDELRGGDLGALGQGDEVQVVGTEGVYRYVLCPDGRRGWVHKMTLGDVPDEEPAPTAVETWATGDPNDDDGRIDLDVLTAFLAARGQA